MKSYVWLTFAFMGWGYYELSGGGDFVPEERPTLVAEAETAPAPELVTRSETTTLLSVSTSNIAQPAVEDEAVIIQASAPVVAEAPAVAEPIDVVAPVVEPKLDLREVGGSRVNMRMGPGTNFDVITTLNSGTKLEVLSVNADGWANVSTFDRGIEGWMAERLLVETTE